MSDAVVADAAVEISAEVNKLVESANALSGEDRKQFLLELVSGQTMLWMSDFVDAFCDKFNVSASAPAVAMVGPGAVEEEVEKSSFDVHLTEIGGQKIQVIKKVRELTDLRLTEVKELVERAPVAVKEGLARDEADRIKQELEDVGATIEIK